MSQKRSFFFLFLFFCLISTRLFAQYDWDGIDIPVDPVVGQWELIDETSDDFNYEAPADNKGAIFNSKWKDGFINGWKGPGNTEWIPDNARVTNGNLEIKATRVPGTTDKVHFQAISTKTAIKYPVFVETRMKVMNSVMANAVWMLSSDSAEEIDIVEAYGSSYSESASSSKEWFAKRMHLSHHTFDRSVTPALDYQPTDNGSWYTDGSYWRDGFRRVGVYWRDPFHLEYYIDGVLVRTVSGAAIIDPNEYLNGNGLSSEEKIIISGAAQGWQVNNGVWPTDWELADTDGHTFKVDWIRTYKDKGETASASEFNLSRSLAYSNPVLDFITIKSNSNLKQLNVYNVNGFLVKTVKNIPSKSSKVYFEHLASGLYFIKLEGINGRFDVMKIIKN
ncbi:T9SS type A sorting domain-containing protein [uncultured Algibacter sp.]|uniref:T9SS type A sorting domain-containing protein n=1 Tax=uncultured Algibacter sp. TaxID=298659 RepID=UPI0026384812|nr:T9SS type A sorting domain-containing protein [uncultured Algibacter sp.]